MDTQCTGRRIANKELLIKETMAYMNYRNEKKVKNYWNFDCVKYLPLQKKFSMK